MSTCYVPSGLFPFSANPKTFITAEANSPNKRVIITRALDLFIFLDLPFLLNKPISKHASYWFFNLHWTNLIQKARTDDSPLENSITDEHWPDNLIWQNFRHFLSYFTLRSRLLPEIEMKLDWQWNEMKLKIPESQWRVAVTPNGAMTLIDGWS